MLMMCQVGVNEYSATYRDHRLTAKFPQVLLIPKHIYILQVSKALFKIPKQHGLIWSSPNYKRLLWSWLLVSFIRLTMSYLHFKLLSTKLIDSILGLGIWSQPWAVLNTLNLSFLWAIFPKNWLDFPFYIKWKLERCSQITSRHGRFTTKI